MPDPLHPAIVHFPIVFAFLLPIAAAVALYLMVNKPNRTRLWLPVAALSLALAGSAWLAVETGEDQEEVIEDVVARAPLHDHEERAEAFLLAAGLLAFVSLLGAAPGRTGTIARGATGIGSVVVLGMAFFVGRSGGALVYEEGAAAAYVMPRTPDATARTPEWGDDHDDDDDDGRR
jgi:uncharacterized membrane protein